MDGDKGSSSPDQEPSERRSGSDCPGQQHARDRVRAGSPPNNAVIMHEEAVALMARLMKEKGTASPEVWKSRIRSNKAERRAGTLV